MEIIAADNTELLAHILGDIQQRAYIDTVRDVQQQLSESPDQIDVPVQHHFAPGVYMRQMDAAAGTLVVSKMHRTEHMNILLKGSLTVATEDGIQLMTAPCVLKSMPGTKRIGYFHEDSSWITIHPTSDTDLEKIEQQVIVPDDEIDQFLASLPNRLKEIE
ncbi:MULTISPECIES: hypothetical protein [Acinetobacter]|jgi:hypothetical protein|uniref:hypothetical protein n=1 Tax=Acinetobacter TaxID=469 RepID=UPI0007D0A77B|nr:MULTISPECIES: hypothetical protein [Acinetobacter]MRA02530.1 hypothetical protein [Acinetobacter lwoffii]OAL84470.1 hypothetical protein AY605_07355 [Acinetobacter sp. SFD]UNT60466.1 hypothetical protein IHE35_06615 [Acinetobacter sp. ASP199]